MDAQQVYREMRSDFSLKEYSSSIQLLLEVVSY